MYQISKEDLTLILASLLTTAKQVPSCADRLDALVRDLYVQYHVSLKTPLPKASVHNITWLDRIKARLKLKFARL